MFSIKYNVWNIFVVLLFTGKWAHGEVIKDFITRNGQNFMLKGFPYRFGGTNCYYISYSSHYEVDQLLETAVANNFSVIRIWGFNDVDSLTETGFQYWNGTQPAYNDGPSGLEHIDYVVSRAKQMGIYLIISLTNNWKDYGGIQQYVNWRGDGICHGDFYSDSTIIKWYKKWVEHLLTRVNTITGTALKDEPAILAWELVNEPRCYGENIFSMGSCTPATIAAWIADVANHIKAIDPNHLLGVGDEGFYSGGNPFDYTSNGMVGDTELYASQPGIDFATFHLYPETWLKFDPSWSINYINVHYEIGQRIGKPVVFGEYGLKDQSRRDAVYAQWTQAVIDGGGQGDLFWMLASYQDDGSLYPDGDGFHIYCPGSTCTLLSEHANDIKNATFRSQNRAYLPMQPLDGGVKENSEMSNNAV